MKPDAGWKDAFVLPRIDEWTGFLLAVVGVVLGAAAFDFIGTTATIAAGPRALGSLEYGGKLVTGALLFGLVVWTGLRLAKGADDAPEIKETVLWSASLVATLVTALRLYQ